LRPAPPQMPHAQGRRSSLTPPLISSSSTGLTTDFTGRQDTRDTGDKYVHPNSVICVRRVADGLTSFSLKGAMNERFERTLKTIGVLEFGKHIVRYSKFKDLLVPEEARRARTSPLPGNQRGLTSTRPGQRRRE
jgi:hypothetical protein